MWSFGVMEGGVDETLSTCCDGSLLVHHDGYVIHVDYHL